MALAKVAIEFFKTWVMQVARPEAHNDNSGDHSDTAKPRKTGENKIGLQDR